jgi:hypothetical protein
MNALWNMFGCFMALPEDETISSADITVRLVLL